MEPSDPTLHFPFTPYFIQKDLMKHLYSTVAQGQVTVIESPTGTGKSLSLLCSTLTALSDSKELDKKNLVDSIRASMAESMADEPDWVLDQEIARQVRELERKETELEERLEEIRRKENAQREGGPRKRQKLTHNVEKTKEDDNEFAPDPYDSDEDENKVDENGEDNYTPAVRALLAKLERKSNPREEEEPDTRKIFYASRTHSQLTSFIEELRKTSFGQLTLNPSDSLPTPANSSSPISSSSAPPAPPSATSRPVRVIPLGSRQNLCINDEVKSKSGGSNEALGDMCMELQKATPEKRCQFLPPQTEPEKLNRFRDKALASVHTIEDIEDLGRKLHTCPYYGSRKAVKSAELVTLPYNLLQKTARESLGISLTNNTVVIDEAHNLIDTLLSLHSISLTKTVLQSLRNALVTYYTKFKARFKGSNAAYLKQLLMLMKGLCEFLEKWEKEREGKKECMMTVNEVLGSMKGGALDQVNLLKLDKYLTESRIARKIGGYMDKLSEEKTAKGRQTLRYDATRNLHKFQSFLLSLTNANSEGRVLVYADSIKLPASADGTRPASVKTEVSLKYMLLAPSESFRDVVESAKSVILAGGTMAPISDFREQLFPYLERDRFSTFSCGHIVDPDHVATFALGVGSTGMKLEFKYDSRDNEKLLDELGRSISSIVQIVPKGVVVFLPAYDFLYKVQARWEKSGLISRLGQKKAVFWEPKASSEVDSVLNAYSEANGPTGKGGLLFAVVGAKLSEGINFKDDMARAVVVCGIPYPNSNSTELKERMKYLDSLPPVAGTSKSGSSAGQVLYQNLAFRAVNQSIGRAIRHANDWAAIILLDARYSQPSKQAQLPKWLGTDVKTAVAFGAFVKGLSEFCKARKGST